MGPQVERQRRDNQGAEGCKEGGVGVPSPLGVRSGRETWGNSGETSGKSGVLVC